MSRYWLLVGLLAILFLGRSTAYGSEENQTIQLTWGAFDPLASEPSIPQQWQLKSRAADASDYRIVQFTRPLTAADRAVLASINVELLAYVPHLSYIANIHATQQRHQEASLATLDFVRWVGEYAPVYRVEPTLVSRSQTERTASAILLVSLFPDADVARVSAEMSALDATIMDSAASAWQTLLQVHADLSTLSQLAAIEGVSWIDEHQSAETQNLVASQITGVSSVRSASLGRETGLYGAGQTIAVADTGLDLGSTDPNQLHDDFEDGQGHSRVLALYDNAYDGTEDHSGHGTHVAGTVLGNGALSGSDPLNGDYAQSHAGVAPQANLILQAIGSDSGSLSGIPWYLTWLFSEAAIPVNGHSAKIHSNSWGIPNSKGLYSSYSASVDQYMWDNPEFLIIFAAGNEGHNGASSIIAPATAKNALSVGATDSSLHSPNKLSGYSGRGPTRDGRIKPDIVAPGTIITSTASGQRYDTAYTTYYGTSMAAPHVAGAAALVREQLANEGHDAPSAALVKGLLINGAFDLSQDSKGNVNVARPTNEAGWGRLDVATAIGITDDRSLRYWDAAGPNQSVALQTGDVATHTVTILNPNVPLNVTLAWTDYPGTTAANGALINDLDLHIVAPDGTLFYPNGANGGVVGGLYDHVNNVVGIDVNAPMAGDYQIVVRGYHVAMASQPYALVASGGFEADPGSCQQPIEGAGTYDFCDTGVVLEVVDGAGIVSIDVEVLDALPASAETPAQLLNRYYRVTVHGDASLTAVVNAVFTYDERSRSAIIHGVSAHQYDGQAWQTYMPESVDTQNSTISVADIALTGSSDWAFGPLAPTSVALHALSASNLTDSLSPTHSAFFFAHNLTNGVKLFSFASNLTVFLSIIFTAMLVSTGLIVRRAAAEVTPR